MTVQGSLDIAGSNPHRHELRRLMAVAGPAVVTGFGWLAMGFTDTVMVGRLGPAELGATALANSLYFTVFVAFFGLINASTPLISQALGSGREDRAGAFLWQGLYLAAAMAPLGVLLCLQGGPVLDLLGQAPEVVAGAGAYLEARSLGVAAHVVFCCHKAFLNGVGATHRVLRIVLVANVVNVLANAVLIFGWGPVPALGVRGAGIATSLCLTALAVGAVLEVHRGGYDRFGLRPVAPPRRDLLRELVQLGWPQSAQYVLEVSGFSATAVCIGWMGPELLSAHEVGCSLAGLAFVVAGGFGTGATVRVGEAFGRGDRAGVARAGRVALAVTTVLMGGIGSLLILAPETMARIYTSEPAVLEAVVGVLGLTGVLAVFDGLQLVAGEALRATSDSRTPLVVHMLGQWLVGLPLGYTLAYPLGWGLPGFWVGIVVSIGLVALVLTAIFLRGGWAARVTAPGPAP